MSPMASFEQRGNSTRVVVRLPAGEKRTATFDTRAEAEAWAAAAEQKKRLGQLAPSHAAGVTVGQMLEAYLDAVGSKTDSAKWNTLRIMKWLLDPLAAQRLADIVTHDVNEWIQRRLRDVSGATVNRELNLLSAAFAYAVRDRRWIPANPCHGARRPERGRPRHRPLLAQAELAAICAATGYSADPELRTLTARAGACFLLALETGMRSGEILRLRPEHVDTASRVALVAAVEQGGRKAAKSGRGRTDPSRRVPLTARAIELLQQLALAPPAEQPYIVGLTDAQRDALWRKARNRSGVPDLRYHDSKHEAATRMAQFIDVLALSHAIGTKDVRLLRDTYYNADAAQAAARLPAQLSYPQ